MDFLLESERLQALRLQECQGTLIGGMRVAGDLGCDAEQYGHRMMAAQQVDWSRLSDDLPRLVAVFAEHYQVTYGFRNELRVELAQGRAHMTMPNLADAAAAQLTHWGADAAALNALQSGFWRLVSEQSGWQVSLGFEPGFNVDIFK
ncbi:MAG: hypothetical protein J4A00_10195 [Gammaproteobacteria bacterium]|nr:hypothetical protein [Gammaproteobacteria bacterium]